MKKLLLIYNPGSGSGRIVSKLPGIVAEFEKAGYEVKLHGTSAPLDGQFFTAAHADGFSLIVAAGGDGTFHETVNGIRSSGADVACGYIPSGTFNDFAASLGIPKNAVKAARTAVSGNYAVIDAGSFNGGLFSYAAAFGLFTEVGYTAGMKAKRALGRFAYYLKVISDLKPSNYRGASVGARIEADGRRFDGEFVYGLVSSALTVAGTTSVLPREVSLSDGMLEYLFIRTPRSQKDITLIRNSLIRREFDPEIAVSGKASAVRVTTERPVSWTLDGEYGGQTGEAEISVIKHAVKIAVPAK